MGPRSPRSGGDGTGAGGGRPLTPGPVAVAAPALLATAATGALCGACPGRLRPWERPGRPGDPRTSR
ncbi:hypothetical protein QFZ75_001547 [Streptomyces sp. V3I8]|uniref:hypothetical protein n=1 Tax=Streptomyces sp. V3I8 TaxID=3042279 RepID=UPI002787B1F8|nr:hypothetical protein [Streptomyces sp. V3I8]MDQ1035131.1 hypothetical protein [Streptomyces sp. V3I8]